jgi:hypothetical protein
MAEFRTIRKSVERRTYIKGSFVGKLTGDIDKIKSDLRTENFYDLQFNTAEILTDENGIRKWDEGGEFEDFISLKPFNTPLPLTDISIRQAGENLKYYSLNLLEPKIKSPELSKQLYEADHVFVTLKGEVCGYLRHFEEIEVSEEIPDPDIDEINDELDELRRSADDTLSDSTDVDHPFAHRKEEVLSASGIRNVGTIGETETAGAATSNLAGIVGRSFQTMHRRLGMHLPGYTGATYGLRLFQNWIGSGYGATEQFRGCFGVLFRAFIVAIVFIYVMVILAAILAMLAPYLTNIFIGAIVLLGILTLRKNIPRSISWIVPALILATLFFLGFC